jgi:uncharacterized protein
MSRLFLFVVATLVALATPPLAFAQKVVQIPTINLRLNDNVAMLSEQDEGELNRLIKKAEAESNAHIVILAIASTAPESIDEFAARVATSLGPTHQGRVVFIVVARDNRPDSERIAIVGWNGAETALDKNSVQRIATEDMLPHFRLLEYRAAFETAIGHVVLLLGGGQLPLPPEEKAYVPPPKQIDVRLLAAAIGVAGVLALFAWLLLRVGSRRVVYITGHRSLNRSFEPMITGSMRKPADFDPDRGNGFGGGFGAARGNTGTRDDFGGSGASGAW